MGGVVASNVAIIKIIASHFGISEDDFFLGAGSDPKATHTNPYHTGDVAAIMRGEIRAERFWANFSRRTGIAIYGKNSTKGYPPSSPSGDPWYDFFNPVLNKGVVDIITGLKNRGQRVVCGTNTMEAHYRRHSERRDYSVFDSVYASHIMRIIKPDPAFWTHILEKEKVLPEQTFFVDDLEENIQAAEKLGLVAHLFTDSESLAAALNRGS